MIEALRLLVVVVRLKVLALRRAREFGVVHWLARSVVALGLGHVPVEAQQVAELTRPSKMAACGGMLTYAWLFLSVPAGEQLDQRVSLRNEKVGCSIHLSGTKC